MPVRYWDQGSKFDPYSASAAGRTCRMIAFRCRSRARSSSLIISCCCSSTGSPGLEGQSILATVATHAPRNSRGSSGGGVSAHASCWPPRPSQRRPAVATARPNVALLEIGPRPADAVCMAVFISGASRPGQRIVTCPVRRFSNTACRRWESETRVSSTSSAASGSQHWGDAGFVASFAV